VKSTAADTLARQPLPDTGHQHTPQHHTPSPT
jgi:hypothetical protein